MKLWILFALVCPNLSLEVAILNSTSCRSLEVEEKVLEISNMDQILYVLDLTSELPLSVANEFAKSGDSLAHSCATNMTKRVESMLSIFVARIALFQRNQEMSKAFLARSALAKSKRFEGGSLALLIAALSLVLSTTGIVVSQTQINQINSRLHTMSVFIDTLQETQRQIANNIGYLYEQTEFIGVEKDLLVEHLNEMKSIYSCNFMTANFETALLRLEWRLNTLFKEMVDRKFSHDFIDLASLDNIVQHDYFRDTIYVFNPSALYNLGQIDFVSLKGSKLTILLSFPRILRDHKYKRVNLVESPRKLLFEYNSDQYYSFLLPTDVRLKNVSQNLSKLRSSQNCLKTSLFTACNVEGVLPYDNLQCLSKLLTGSDDHCFARPSTVYDFHVSYTKKGALISMHGNVKVIDSLKHMVLHKSTLTQQNCVYLTNRKNILVQSDLRKLALFPLTLTFKVVSRKVNLEFQIIDLKNFTRPTFNNTKTYTPIVIPDGPKNDVVKIVAIIMSTIVGLIILVLCMYQLGGCKCRRETIRANEIFPN